MSSALVNPYPLDSFEHAAWKRWNQHYFQQPVHAQMFDLESRLRSSLWILLGLSDRIATPELQRDMRTCLLEFEATIEAVNETAEHAYSTVVTLPGNRTEEGTCTG